MSFSIRKIGTLAGVRAAIAADLYLPGNVAKFIDSCIAGTDTAFNGVEVECSGHGGAISGLRIEPRILCLDPVAPPVVDPTLPPVITDGNPPMVPKVPDQAAS